jgi:hypothetical protein
MRFTLQPEQRRNNRTCEARKTQAQSDRPAQQSGRSQSRVSEGSEFRSPRIDDGENGRANRQAAFRTIRANGHTAQVV